MASRSSYAEVRSRSGIIAASVLLFAAGTAATAGIFGFIAPKVMAPEGVVPTLEEHVLWAAGFACLVVSIAVGSFFLSRNGRAVARAMRGTKVCGEDREKAWVSGAAEERKLDHFIHCVEICALSAGLGYVPAAYVLFGERGINAFAAGNGPNSGVVAITAGALEAFDEAEIEGVVGHEIAHISQGDTKTAAITASVCTALLFMSELGWIALRTASFSSGSRDSKARAAALGVGLALIAAGLAGALFGRLLQAFISRNSEFRADAAGALYAGTPSGLVSALEKIERINRPELGTELPTRFSHMMLAPPSALMNRSARALNLAFASHPPMTKRIRALGGEENADSAAK